MFDATLGRAQVQPARLGQGAVLSIGAHVLVLGLVWASPRSARDVRKEPEVVFVMPKQAPPPPLGGARAQDKPRPETPRKTVKKNAMVMPSDKPPDRTPEPAEPQELAGEGGDPNGDPNGRPGGVPGGRGEGGSGAAGPIASPPPEPPPAPRPVIVPFDSAKMDRPVLRSGSTPEYPARARAARVEATVLVQCVVTTEGTLRSCRVLKGHPLLDDTVLSTLGGQRYRPALYAGKPISVNYVFTFRFKLQG
jgi:periplasmic protein TonB